MAETPQFLEAHVQSVKPAQLADQVKLTLLEYSESSFTDPHTVVSPDEPQFDPEAYSHIGKMYEGVEPYRMGGHTVAQRDTTPSGLTHHFDPNHREHVSLQLELRAKVETLCISTRFFAGNPASDVTVTLIDDVLIEEHVLPIPLLNPDAEHWLVDINVKAARVKLHFKAGGITRVWAFGQATQAQPEKLSWLSKNSEVLFKEDDFFGGPDFALSERADRSTQHMLGWETSRSAMGLQAVFPIVKGAVKEVMIDTYRHVNNYLRSAWVLSARLPEGYVLTKDERPLWRVTSSEGEECTTGDLRSFFSERHRGAVSVPTYTITPAPHELWSLEASFELKRDAMHIQSNLHFDATHICVMLLPHGGLHAIKVMGVPAKEVGLTRQ